MNPENNEDFPSIFEQAKNLTKAVGKHAAGGFQKVTIVEYANRLSVCGGCEYEKDGKCSECGCYLKVKAWWKSEDCPKDKWDKLE